MPLKVSGDLPAKSILEGENIFVMDEWRAIHQDIRPIQIGILNLMPVKEETELQLLRALSNTPLQVDVSFFTFSSHESKNTSKSHLNKFYTPMRDFVLGGGTLDGLIVTGAPLELMDYEDIDFWDEMKNTFDWAGSNVTSIFCICWGALAGLYHYYGIPTYRLDKKVSGVYRHRVFNRKIPLLRAFDDVFLAPHSRNAEVRRQDIEKHKELTILAESDEAGVFLLMENDGSKIFVTGHMEYDRMTLDGEYHRDMEKGLSPDIPVNYYPEGDPSKKPYLTWRANSNNLYTNWLNYYVYQTTPYDITKIHRGNHV